MILFVNIYKQYIILNNTKDNDSWIIIWNYVNEDRLS